MLAVGRMEPLEIPERHEPWLHQSEGSARLPGQRRFRMGDSGGFFLPGDAGGSLAVGGEELFDGLADERDRDFGVVGELVVVVEVVVDDLVAFAAGAEAVAGEGADVGDPAGERRSPGRRRHRLTLAAARQAGTGGQPAWSESCRRTSAASGTPSSVNSANARRKYCSARSRRPMSHHVAPSSRRLAAW